MVSTPFWGGEIILRRGNRDLLTAVGCESGIEGGKKSGDYPNLVPIPSGFWLSPSSFGADGAGRVLGLIGLCFGGRRLPFGADWAGQLGCGFGQTGPAAFWGRLGRVLGLTGCLLGQTSVASWAAFWGRSGHVLGQTSYILGWMGPAAFWGQPAAFWGRPGWPTGLHFGAHQPHFGADEAGQMGRVLGADRAPFWGQTGLDNWAAFWGRRATFWGRPGHVLGLAGCVLGQTGLAIWVAFWDRSGRVLGQTGYIFGADGAGCILGQTGPWFGASRLPFGADRAGQLGCILGADGASHILGADKPRFGVDGAVFWGSLPRPPPPAPKTPSASVVSRRRPGDGVGETCAG